MSVRLPADVIHGAKGRYRLDDAAPREVGPARLYRAEGPQGEVELRFGRGDEAWLLEETALLRELAASGGAAEVLDYGKHEGRIYVVHPVYPLTLAGWLALDHAPRERAHAALLAVRSVAAVHRLTCDARLGLSPASFGVRGRGERLEVRLLDPGVAAARVGVPAPAIDSYTPPEARIGRDTPRGDDVWALGVLVFRALCGSLPQAVVLRAFTARVERREELASARPLPAALDAELVALDGAPIPDFYPTAPALLPQDEAALRAAGADDALVHALRHALAPDPADRARDLDALDVALAALPPRLPGPPPAPPPPPRPLLPAPPRLTPTALLGIVMAAALAVAWWAVR